MSSRAGLILGAVVIMTVTAARAGADFDARRWQYYRQIKPSAGRAARYAQVTLDKDVLCRSRGDLTDLRVIAGRRETAYKLLADAGTVEETRYSPAILNRSDVPGKYSSFVLDLGKPGRINNRLGIQTPDANFTRKVTIEASRNGQDWATVRNDAYIFDFSRDYHSRSTQVNYPDSSLRYIRVKVWHSSQPALKVDSAVVFWRRSQAAREMPLFAGTGTITQNSTERSTDVVLDTKCRYLPEGRLVIASPDANYHRQVEIAGSADREQWQDLGSGSILKYNTPEFKGEESSVSYYGAACRYIRVRIRNYDDQPIRVSKIAAFTVKRRLFFPCRSQGGFRLYYGNAAARSPVYDIQDTFRYLASEKAFPLSLGPRAANLQFVKAKKTWLEENPWSLWVVLGAAVVILGLFTIRLVMQMKPSATSQG